MERGEVGRSPGLERSGVLQILVGEGQREVADGTGFDRADEHRPYPAGDPGGSVGASSRVIVTASR